MSNQQPSSTHEPTLAEFREFLLDVARENPQPGFWRSTMQEGVTRIFVDTIDTYLAHRAEQAPADDGWGDPLSRSNLVSVARAHRNASRPKRAEAGDLDRLLDDLAQEFGLADVRIIRGVAAALADAMPRIAHKAREQDMTPDEIAQQSGYTSSRVAQFIRQERERRGPLTRYTWRIDTQDTDGTWLDREVGEDEAAPADLAQLAERLLAGTGARDRRARIFLWEGDESTDADAVHTAERNPQ